jgi:uncharacterized membrane protein
MLELALVVGMVWVVCMAPLLLSTWAQSKGWDPWVAVAMVGGLVGVVMVVVSPKDAAMVTTVAVAYTVCFEALDRRR